MPTPWHGHWRGGSAGPGFIFSCDTERANPSAACLPISGRLKIGTGVVGLRALDSSFSATPKEPSRVRRWVSRQSVSSRATSGVTEKMNPGARRPTTHVPGCRAKSWWSRVGWQSPKDVPMGRAWRWGGPLTSIGHASPRPQRHTTQPRPFCFCFPFAIRLSSEESAGPTGVAFKMNSGGPPPPCPPEGYPNTTNLT